LSHLISGSISLQKMNKQDLRKKYLKIRQGMSDAEVWKATEKISNQFFKQFSIEEVRYLHSFLPIDHKKEPNTWILIEKIWNDYPDVEIVVPRLIPGSKRFESIILTSGTKLLTSNWGILEPEQGTSVSEEMIDIVFVPLLAADNDGFRVGYGKGYYDQFLRLCKPTTIRAGLGFYPPVAAIDDLHDGDVPLDYLITPDKVYRFNR